MVNHPLKANFNQIKTRSNLPQSLFQPKNFINQIFSIKLSNRLCLIVAKILSQFARVLEGVNIVIIYNKLNQMAPFDLRGVFFN